MPTRWRYPPINTSQSSIWKPKLYQNLFRFIYLSTSFLNQTFFKTSQNFVGTYKLFTKTSAWKV